MRKKQLLKLGNGRKGKVIGCAVLSLALVGMIGGGTMAAGNVGDTDYYFYSMNWNATETREKKDATSAYIRHDGSVDVNVEVRSGSVNFSKDGATFSVPKGTRRYLPNYVYETGRRNCYLYMRQTGGTAYSIYGAWSPDSV